MKCDNCRALRSEGYEYPEEYCLLGYEVMENLCNKNDDGCTLHHKTIESLVNMAEEMHDWWYGDIDGFDNDKGIIRKALTENDIKYRINLCKKYDNMRQKAGIPYEKPQKIGDVMHDLYGGEFKEE